MKRYPEFIQFRGTSGFTAAIEQAAKAQGLANSEFIRAAVEARVASAGIEVVAPQLRAA